MTPLFGLLLACSTSPGPTQESAPGEPAAASEGEPHAHHAHHDHAGHANHQDMPAGEAVPGQSLFQLESAWTDHQGKTLSLDELGGAPIVLAMVYTHCEHACPRIVADMHRIQGELGERAKDVHFVLVSIDPERDSVDRMATFARETGIDAEGWRVLRGEEADVRELAAVLGVQYKRVSPSDFAHSNLVHVLDADGVIAHRQEGLGTAPTATVAALEGLLATPGR